MFQEMIHIVATKIALISIAFLSIFNPHVSFPEENRFVRIEISSENQLPTPDRSLADIAPIVRSLDTQAFPKIKFPELSDIQSLFPRIPEPIQTRRTPVVYVEQQTIPQADPTPPEPAPTPTITPTATPTPTAPTIPGQTPFDVITSETRNAVVNILCTSNVSGLGSATGSGVIIDPKGVVLTNAHVAQLFLLDGQRPGLKVDCLIRTGDPARPMYRGELLYISPTWITKNPDTLVQKQPRGTGENDFAFLRITESYDKQTQLPATFPYARIDTHYVPEPEDVLILAGYPVGLLDSISITNNLRLQTIAGYVTDVFTFDKTTVDLFQIRDSVVAQSGSSGGAVVNNKNNLGGIIVTSVRSTNNPENIALRAITLGHINRALIVESGQSISSLVSGDIREKARVFKTDTAPALSKLLVDTIFK